MPGQGMCPGCGAWHHAVPLCGSSRPVGCHHDPRLHLGVSEAPTLHCALHPRTYWQTLAHTLLSSTPPLLPGGVSVGGGGDV